MRRATLLAAIVLPLGLAWNPLAPERAECAGLLDCGERPQARVADGSFKGSLEVQVKGGGGDFTVAQSMTGPIELDIADQKATGNALVAVSQQVDAEGVDGHGTLARAPATIQIAGPARMAERIRGAGSLGGGMAAGFAQGLGVQRSAVRESGEIVLAIKEASCGALAGDVVDGTVKDMETFQMNLGSTPTTTTRWRVTVQGRDEALEQRVAALAADARQGDPSDAKLQALLATHKEVVGRSTRAGDYFECLGGELRAGMLDLLLRRVQVALDGVPPAGTRLSRAEMVSLLERVIGSARAAIEFGAPEKCVLDAVNGKLLPVLEPNLSRELREATDLPGLISLARLGQFLGIWDDAMNDAFYSALGRLAPGAG